MAKAKSGRGRKHVARQPVTVGTKNPAAVALGKLGGIKGGPARDRKLSARRKKAIASLGQQALQRKRAQGGKKGK